MAYNNTFPYDFPIWFYTTTRRFIKTEVGQKRKILTSVAQNRQITTGVGQYRKIITTVDSGVYGEF